MDNYFWLERILKECPSLSIGCLGTTKNWSGIAPGNYKSMPDDVMNSIYFNSTTNMTLCIVNGWMDRQQHCQASDINSHRI